MKKKISIIILSFNSEKTISRSIKSCKKISKNVFIIDSFSNDSTIKICKKLKCKIYKHKFKNYSDQRNWAINKFKKISLWQLHLDADDVLDIKAINSIKKKIKTNSDKAFLIKREEYFLNQKMIYTGKNFWHLRLFKPINTMCENTLYDQHFITKDKLGKLDGCIQDNGNENLKQYINKMKRWAKYEAKSHFINKDKNKIFIFSRLDPRAKTRSFKNTYYQFPRYIRVFIYFIYRYFFKLGFLDGYIGFLFFFYQGFLFRFMVDIEIGKLINIKNNYKY